MTTTTSGASPYIRVRLDTAFGSFFTTVTRQVTAKQLIDKILRALGFKEVCYFGMIASDTTNFQRMLTMGTEVLNQVHASTAVLNVRFLVCFPPYDVDDLQQYGTKKSLFIGARDMVLAGRYYCSPEHAFLMAAIAAHVRYGSYSPDVHPANLLEKTKLLPERVASQLNLSQKEIVQKVTRIYQTLPKASREDAMMTYLRMAQDLDQYGVRYCDVTNQDGFQLVLGVCPFGLLFFKPDNRLAPVTAFHFGEVSQVSFRNNFVNIDFQDGDRSRTITLDTGSLVTSKRMCVTLVGLSEIFVRAVDPDPNEHEALVKHAQQEKNLRLARNRSQCRGEKTVAAAELRWRQNVQRRLQEYDTKFNQIHAQLTRLSSASATLERRLKDGEEKVASYAGEYQKCMRQKDFYNHEMDMNIALVPALTRTGMRVSKKTIAQEREVYFAQAQVDQMREQQSEIQARQKKLQEVLKTLGSRKRDHLAASNMSPYDSAEEGTFDMKPKGERTLPIPWDNKECFCDKDYNILMELERLQSELSECRLRDKLTADDLAYETNRERLQINKFGRLRDLRKTPIADRIKLVNNCKE